MQVSSHPKACSRQLRFKKNKFSAYDTLSKKTIWTFFFWKCKHKIKISKYRRSIPSKTKFMAIFLYSELFHKTNLRAYFAFSTRLITPDQCKECIHVQLTHFNSLRPSSFASFKNGRFIILITEWHKSSFLVLKLGERSPVIERRICHSLIIKRQ